MPSQSSVCASLQPILSKFIHAWQPYEPTRFLRICWGETSSSLLCLVFLVYCEQQRAAVPRTHWILSTATPLHPLMHANDPLLNPVSGAVRCASTIQDDRSKHAPHAHLNSAVTGNCLSYLSILRGDCDCKCHRKRLCMNITHRYDVVVAFLWSHGRPRERHVAGGLAAIAAY